MTAPGDYESILQRSPRLLGVPAFPLVALAVANLFPLVGVLLLDWDTRGLLLLYWAENLVVALWAAVRMLVVGGVLAIPLIAFFCVHFGVFMFVHLVFVVSLTSMSDGQQAQQELMPHDVLSEVSWWALAALLVSHGISFVRNFLGRQEWKTATMQGEMGRPYPRMAVMHVAIIIGAFFVATLGEPTALLVVLVLLKTVVDAMAHVAEHRLRRAPG